ncbi:hypothetical protein EI77_03066 [Prosthecobacter fusiformis]|uniref:ChlI/MoxR AAA lid domain-containing protein n=1 Tax=Prosthecobacter fusiformis TaxID=48464 RepID=A0A4V3FFB0_9BACT|nr:hypothetical protein [Prosthecobacter fusiformis]TDU69413.1 hypothetical protein EI77_03066 [Prosthecobacter fusiformis]
MICVSHLQSDPHPTPTAPCHRAYLLVSLELPCKPNGQRNSTAVSTDDIRAIAHVALRHRIILNFEGEAQQIRVDDLITKVLDQVKTPAQQAA